MDRLLVNISLNGPFGPFLADGLNRPRKMGEMIVFTPYFHKTTLTTPDGEELVVVNDVIESIVQGGSTKIPENGYVISIQANHPLFNHFEVGKPMSFSTQITPLTGFTTAHEWDRLDYIVGGTPLLVHHRARMTIEELIDLMVKLGSVYALNLDGGGSSTMVYEESIKNCPRGDEAEGKEGSYSRRVSDAIIIVPKK